MERFLKGSGTPFCVLRQRVCAVCEKVSSQTVSRSEDEGSSIAKPCKPYSTSFKIRSGAHDRLRPSTCFPKGFILVRKASFWEKKPTSKLMSSGVGYGCIILGGLGVVWRSNLDVFWRASWRNTVAQIRFFWSQADIECFFVLRWRLGLILECLWSLFWL